ncbi:hypothetical protein [Tabrizicola sp.]|uniref:hypothetical protein n=1 Tax=Tabrizicola sp. TaxID=2005166 RepID=UPI003F3B1F9E
MRIALNSVVLLAAGLLTACNSEEECTAELLEKKGAELDAKVAEVQISDPEKLFAMQSKVYEAVQNVAAAGEDISGQCKIIDELVAELSK